RARPPSRRPRGCRSAAPRGAPAHRRAAPAEPSGRRGGAIRARSRSWLDPSRNEEGPCRGPLTSESDRFLDRLDVRGLRALRALHNLERHALAFGQRLVAVHPDRREVHEHIVATFTLDEAVALLVREPLNGALCQLVFLLTNYDGPASQVADRLNPAEHSS